MDTTNTPNSAAVDTAPVTPAAKKARKPAAKKATKKPTRRAVKTDGVKRLTKAEIKAANPTGKCLCGCGKQVPRRFLQGHDAQLHSRVLEAFKAEKTVRVSKTTAEYLKTASWMTKELARIVRS